MRFAFLIFPIAAGGAFSLAAGATVADGTSGIPPLPVIECYCTDWTGARVEMGQTICLMVDGRAYLATCEMSLNVPAWRDTGSDCVGARLDAGVRPRPLMTALGGA